MRTLLSSFGLVAAGFLTATTAAQTTVDLRDSPVAASGRGAASNLILSLSVEFPTVGAAYRSGTYNNNLRTLGYWDADSCYTYVGSTNAGLIVPASAAAQNVTNGFFRRSGPATNFQCSNAWSGNFLNWAAQSSIDSLRYALTGGDRIIDTTSQTVLMRADLPTSFYRSGAYFPGKSITVDANRYTPFTGTVHIANCRNVIYFGTAGGGSCDAPGNNGNLIAVRAAVEVCSATEGPLRGDLCKQQVSGAFKPTGLMQQYADRIRFAAFGYALDSGNARYGGVLRAPMKYVGEFAYDAALNKTNNAAREWDPTTGVFVAAPLPLQPNATFSGVANYLNRFGRVTKTGVDLSNTTGATSAVLYKGNDPVSELYYEAIRYVQGQQPTPAAVSGLSAAMYDGFPIYPAWTDPITASCQDTSIIQIADAYTHNDKTIPGNTRTNGSGDTARGVGAGEPNVVTWTNAVGAFEGRPNLGNEPGGCCDGSHYIAGLAYWANTQPIRTDRPNIRVKTYVINVDENGNGTIRNRERVQQLYLAAKYGGFSDTNGDGNPFSTPPDNSPAVNKWASGLDDDGMPLPKTFFLASSPQRMVNSLRAAFAAIATTSGTLAGGAVSSTLATASGTDVYTVSLDAENDAASILALPLTYNAATSSVNVSATPRWDAAKKLTGVPTGPLIVPPKDPASRNMFATLGSGVTTSLLWTSFDAATQTLFNTSPDTGLVDGLGALRVAYIRGDRNEEVSKGTPSNPKPFRNRKSLVASIVNSAPVYVGAKPSISMSGNGYESFYRSTNRRPTVYVGTNNGVLHAFDAATGDETFAFVPQPFTRSLVELTSPNFAKRPMVDAKVVVSEAVVSGAWKSVLVSGYGGGAQGVFALDITNPASFGSDKVLWHFSDADDPRMGNLTSPPKVVKFRTGPSTFRWFAVVPSGYNNNAVDSVSPTPVRYDTDNTRSLFLLSLDKPSSTSWSLGTNYYRIDLPNGYRDTSIQNSLSTPGIEVGAEGEVIRMYAGDTQGNLWKFDFALATNPFASNTAIQNVIGFGGGASGKPLFTALNGTNRQPITMEPYIGSVQGGRANVVTFGTGKFIEGADTSPANYRQQAIYGVMDDLSNTNASRVDSIAKLQARTAASVGTTLTVTGSAFRYGIPTPSNPDVRMGWYFNLPGVGQGERQVTNFAIANNFIFFNSLASVAAVGNACSAYGGRQYALNGATGLSNGATGDLNTDGFLPAPIVLETDDSGANTTSTAGQGYAVTSSAPLIVTLVGGRTTSGDLSTVSVKRPPVSRKQERRLSWREIVDYNKIKK